MITSIKKILADTGTSPVKLRNPRFMAAMANELRELGFTRATRVVNGKRRRVWISADEVLPADLVRAAVLCEKKESSSG